MFVTKFASDTNEKFLEKRWEKLRGRIPVLVC